MRFDIEARANGLALRPFRRQILGNDELFGKNAGVTLEDFVTSLEADAPSPALAAPLAALWWAERGAWDTAHAIVQDEAGADAAWVHATLHRREGDLDNAAYWYRRAGRPVGRGSAQAEWRLVAMACLDRESS